MAEVLVTGGAGFIGSHLQDRLLEQGHAVIVVDNLRTGKRNHVPSSLNDPREDQEINIGGMMNL